MKSNFELINRYTLFIRLIYKQTNIGLGCTQSGISERIILIRIGI